MLCTSITADELEHQSAIKFHHPPLQNESNHYYKV